MVSYTWSYSFNNDNECFIRDSKHLETDETTRPHAEYFYFSEVFGIPDEIKHEARVWLLKLIKYSLFLNPPRS
jgi:hypothetical protein